MSVLLAVFEMNTKVRVGSDGIYTRLHRFSKGFVTTLSQIEAATTLTSMATWDDVRRIALSLPEAGERTSRGHAQWIVKDKLFVWERPLRKPDLAALGDSAPDGPILGARVEHEIAKQALIADDPDVFFTTPHFDGYPAILVQLEKIDPKTLEEVIVEAWLCRAPPRLVKEYNESAR